MKLKIALLLSISLFSGMVDAGENPKSGTFRLPSGITSEDMVPGTIIFKLKPEFRNQARVDGITNDRLNEVLAAQGITTVKKKFPAKQAALYLHMFQQQREGGWLSLTKAIEAHAELKLEA